MSLQNSYAQLPAHFFAAANPASVPAPKLLAWNEALAEQLGLGHLSGDEAQLAQIFSGNQPLEGAAPIALAYAGHQFGHFQAQLGDGRATLLGDVPGADGKRYDLQLKGSGQTAFSRGGDGKSSLGPVIREYLLCEAMYHLGVPTTRALAAVSTGEDVFRDEAEPGGVFTRVAASHVRVGTFEYFAARGDTDGVNALADFAIARHYPQVKEANSPYLALFEEVVKAQARLVAHWMDVGFIHGVMNTDNFTISGETLDYGPCAFMDEFNANKVFSSIDQRGRYAYANQGPIAQWNLARLAECLLQIDDREEVFTDALARFEPEFEQHYSTRMRAKLGLTEAHDGDAVLIGQWLSHLQEHEIDYTLASRQLSARVDAADDEPVFGEFETQWRARLVQQASSSAEVIQLMDSVNPLYIPRNHQVERAIQGAFAGDLTVFNELREVLRRPFDAQPGFTEYAQAPEPEQRVARTFCGT